MMSDSMRVWVGVPGTECKTEGTRLQVHRPEGLEGSELGAVDSEHRYWMEHEITCVNWCKDCETTKEEEALYEENELLRTIISLLLQRPPHKRRHGSVRKNGTSGCHFGCVACYIEGEVSELLEDIDLPDAREFFERGEES